MGDWISIVEAAYRLDGDHQAWLDSALARARPLLDRGHGVLGYVYATSPASSLPTLRSASSEAENLLAAYGDATSTYASAEAAQRFAHASTTFASLSEFLFRDVQGEASAYRRRTGFADVVGLVAATGTGYGISLAAPSRTIVETTATERRQWACVAAHLGAGLRLRVTLERLADALPAPEAVLDPAAELHHAAGAAEGERARVWLREAVRRRERARSGPERVDPESALSLWQGLVAGRWSLVDRFESDGKRFVVAHRNDPDVGDPRGLSRRERQVAEYVGLGRSQKEIAYLLGISPAAVSNHTNRAAEKLGLSGLAQLAGFFAPDGLRARLVEFEVGGERLAAGAAPLLDEALLARLSPAEREVALELVRGATLSEIARRRDSTPLTVATQVKAIHAKLGVHSRVELAARLEAAPGG